MLPRVALAGLDAAQASELGRFLTEAPERGAAIQLRDPDASEARIQAAWNHAGTRLIIALQPATPWERALPQVELLPGEVAKLARFLAAGSPGPH